MDIFMSPPSPMLAVFKYSLAILTNLEGSKNCQKLSMDGQKALIIAGIFMDSPLGF
jgi:hypothetical protein